MLGDPRRIIAVRTNTSLGQTMRFLDWRDGQMRNGKVTRVSASAMAALVLVSGFSTWSKYQQKCWYFAALSRYAVIRHEAKKNPLRWGRRAGLRLCETL
ncbi:hypothetical protein [Variovorax sp. Root434]|uniref:hypothetical protein n=1 Tax=Variovorax sp. Root434 TaxID=1736536 RepID=UPI000AD02B59|nr:hypothetical protein [Variovorax sp. Root434]